MCEGVSGVVMVRCVSGCVNSLVLECFAQWVLYAGPSVTVVDLSELVFTSLASGI